MKRILVITPFFYPHVGGSQNYMEELYVSLIQKYPEISVDVLCYNTDGVSKESLHRSLRIYRIPCWTILPDQFCLPKPIPLIRFLFQKRKSYDLIHCSTRFFDSSWWAPLYSKLIGKNIVLTDHCASHPVYKNPIVAIVAKIIDLSIARFCMQFYRRIFVTNKSSQQFIKKTFGFKSRVVYGGVDTSIFKPSKIDKKNRLRIVFVDRMIDSKGVVELFNIARKLSGADFIFAGPGPLAAVLKQQVDELNLKNIHILGSLTHRQVARLLSESDILVHPSYHHEGFPNILTEAGAAKLAVIATDVGGSREIIINNKTGILIPPQDQKALEEGIRTLIKNRDLKEKIRRSLYQHVIKHFSWDKASQQLYKEIKCLLYFF